MDCSRRCEPECTHWPEPHRHHLDLGIELAGSVVAAAAGLLDAVRTVFPDGTRSD